MSAESGLEKVLITQPASDQLAVSAMEHEQDYSSFVNTSVATGLRLFELSAEHERLHLCFWKADHSGYSLLPLDITAGGLEPVSGPLVELPLKDSLLEKVHIIAQSRTAHRAEVASTAMRWRHLMLLAKSQNRHVMLATVKPGCTVFKGLLAWGGIEL